MNKLFLSISVSFFILAGCSTEKRQESAKESTEVQVSDPVVEKQELSADTITSKQMDRLLSSYFEIKNALVNSDAEKARTEAVKFIAYLTDDMFGLKKAASDMQGEENIEEMRADFEELSIQMYEMAKNNDALIEKTIYKQYCPMAFDNEGAFWLSSEEEIRNPYFGDKMLKCGRVQEEI